MKLIDKAAVLAEIEKKYNQEVQWINRQGYTEYHKGLRDSYADTLSFIDTLEVKEVNVKEEMSKYLGDDIEYVRKDAFIEKVKSFLNMKDDRDCYTIGYIKRHLEEIIKEIGL